MKLACLFCLISLILFSQSLPARAHELRPAYLQMTETKPGEFSVLWKVPQRGDAVLGLHVKWPAYEEVAPGTSRSLGGAFVTQKLLRFPDGLVGRSITIEGLSATYTDVLARVEFLNGVTQTYLAKPGSPSFKVQGKKPLIQVARDYMVLGIEHILTGIDHLLFVLSLMIITGGGWKLAKTITAFTLSHCLSLTAAVLGIVHVPQKPVEASIALSIVFVASEILRLREGRETITSRAPWVVAFAFGLLHGLGFAGALGDAGLPQGNIPAALLFFSTGVEAGHFLFVGAVLSLLALGRRVKFAVPKWAHKVPPYAIGGIAAFWLFQRVSGF